MGSAGAITGLAISILIVGIGATVLASYTFFVILPPALANVNQAAWELIHYNPGTEQQFYSGSAGLRNAGTDLQNLGLSLPCSDNGGCFRVFDLSPQRNQLTSMGSNLQSIADNVHDVGDDFVYTVSVIHTVGYGTLGVKDGLYYGVMTMLGLGLSVILTGTALLVVARALKVIEKRGVTSKV